MSTGFKPEDYRIHFWGKILENSKSLSACGLFPECRVFCLPKPEEPKGDLSLLVKSLNGDVFEINVMSTGTVEDIKKAIFKVKSYSADQQKLGRSGKVLTDKTAIKSYNLKDGDSISLTLVLAGGYVGPKRE